MAGIVFHLLDYRQNTVVLLEKYFILACNPTNYLKTPMKYIYNYESISGCLVLNLNFLYGSVTSKCIDVRIHI